LALLPKGQTTVILLFPLGAEDGSQFLTSFSLYLRLDHFPQTRNLILSFSLKSRVARPPLFLPIPRSPVGPPLFFSSKGRSPPSYPPEVPVRHLGGRASPPSFPGQSLSRFPSPSFSKSNTVFFPLGPTSACFLLGEVRPDPFPLTNNLLALFLFPVSPNVGWVILPTHTPKECGHPDFFGSRHPS